MEKPTRKTGKRATVCYMVGKKQIKKDVPASRAILIADEYRRKTGNSVRIRIS